MNALLVGLLVGAVGGWVACDVLVAQRVKRRAEQWVRRGDSVRRPW